MSQESFPAYQEADLDPSIRGLSRQQAQDALELVCQRWVEDSPAETFAVANTVWSRYGERVSRSSAELESMDDEALGHVFRSALQAIYEGENRQYVAEAVKQVSDPSAHSLTALVLGLAGIAGGTTVLCILAARISQVGGGDGFLKFFRGLPKETSETVKAGASLAVPLLDTALGGE